jgi:hypothetical protein
VVLGEFIICGAGRAGAGMMILGIVAVSGGGCVVGLVCVEIPGETAGAAVEDASEFAGAGAAVEDAGEFADAGAVVEDAGEFADAGAVVEDAGEFAGVTAAAVAASLLPIMVVMCTSPDCVSVVVVAKNSLLDNSKTIPKVNNSKKGIDNDARVIFTPSSEKMGAECQPTQKNE